MRTKINLLWYGLIILICVITVFNFCYLVDMLIFFFSIFRLELEMMKMMSSSLNSQIALWKAISVYGHSAMCHSTVYLLIQSVCYVYLLMTMDDSMNM
jgi:hypothetical protein